MRAFLRSRRTNKAAVRVPVPVCRTVCEELESRVLLTAVANPDAFNTLTGTPLVFGSSDLLSNDSGAAVVTSLGPPQTGTVATQSNGSFVYTPATNGTDSFSYTAQGNGTGRGLLLEIRQGKADNFIPLDSMSWAVVPGGGTSSPATAQFELTARADRWSPGLFMAVAQGSALGTVVITHRDATGILDEMWTLGNASATSYSTSTGTVASEDRFTLAATQVAFSHLNYDSTGHALPPTTTGWDYSAQAATQTAPFVKSTVAPGSVASLQVSKGPAWPVSSYSWLLDPTRQTLGSLVFTEPSGVESPALVSATLNKTVIPDLTLSASVNGGTLTWDMQQVKLTFYTTSIDNTGVAPDTFSLTPQTVAEKFITAAGTRSATFSLPLTSVTNPVDFGNQPPSVGSKLFATFMDASGASLGSVPLSQFAWGMSNTAIGGLQPATPKLSDASLITSPGLFSPAVASELFSGGAIPEVLIQQLDSSSQVAQSWTLHNVLLTQDETNAFQDGTKIESFLLAPAQIEFANTTNGTTASVGYDATSATVTQSASFGGSDLSSATNGPIVHMAPGGDILADSVSWNASRTSPKSQVAFGDFTIAAGSGAESAALLSASLQGRSLLSVTIKQIQSGGVTAEWDLQNVHVSGYTISADGGASPQDTFTLQSQRVTEIIDGITTRWDAGANTGTSTPNFGGAVVTAAPALVLDLLDNSGQDLGQIAVDSAMWGEIAGSSQPQLSSLQLQTAMNVASAGVLASVCDGVAPASAVLNQRDASGQVTNQWTISSPVFRSDSPLANSSGLLSETITLSVGNVTWSASGGASPPAGRLQMVFPDGSTLPLGSLSWAESGSTAGGPSFSSFSMSAGQSALSPLLVQDLAQDAVIDHVAVKRFDASGNLVQEWDLKNVTVGSWATARQPQSGTDSFNLSAQAVTETAYVADTAGKTKTYSATWDLMAGGTGTPDFGGFVPADGSVAIGTITINVVPPATIIGSLFNDQNNNGAKNSGETSLSGWTVYLDSNNNGVLDPGEAQTTTASDGSFTFGPLFPGTYAVREVVPAGWRLTTPVTPAVTQTLVAGQNAVTPLIGYVQVSTVSLNLSYLLILTRNFGKQGTIASGDLNGDGSINLADFLLLAQNYGHSLPAPAAVAAAVPPPTPTAVRRRMT